MLTISETLAIPDEEFEITFARSGGPGGQNVNKVNSKAVLHWNVTASASLPFGVRARFLSKFQNRLTTDGFIVIMSQKFRDQGRNVDDCREKLKDLITEVLYPPTIRRETKPSYGALQKRTQTKKINAVKKQQRQSPKGDY